MNLQIQIGPNATDYEPYTLQSLLHTTPNGFHAIPVSSGGNYTDATGQQWIADYRDWERGVDVKRIWKGVFNGSEDWSIYHASDYLGFYATLLPESMSRREGFCNQLRIDSSGKITRNGLWLGVGDSKEIYCINSDFYNNTLNEDENLTNWKAHLAEYSLEIITYLNNPIETPIPPEELAAYHAAHTNYPNTVIMNDEGCWMEVEYARKPEEIMDEKVQEGNFMVDVNTGKKYILGMKDGLLTVFEVIE